MYSLKNKRSLRCFGTVICLALLAVGAQVVFAGIADGENAIDALGQYDDDLSNPQPVYTKGGADNSPSKFGYSSPWDVTVDTTNHRLFVADTSNNRVLIYTLNNDNTLPDRLPDYVLGQANFYTNTAARTRSGLMQPQSVAVDTGSNLIFVSDNNNCRVLVYSGASLSNGMNAAYVIGQTDFTTGASGLTQAKLNLPAGLDYDTGRDLLFVADNGNERVMIFSGALLATGMNAAYELGQTDFVSDGWPGVNSGSFANLPDVAYDSNNDRIYAIDGGKSRVLVFSGALLRNGLPASYVLGQSDFTTSTVAYTQAGMSSPSGVAYDTDRDRIYVSDGSIERVTVYSGALLSNGMNASYVLGQSNYTGATPEDGADRMDSPAGIYFDTTTDFLYVADRTNDRILIHSGATLTSSQNANDGIGQTDGDLTDPQFVADTSQINNKANRLGFGGVDSVEIDEVNNRLFVADEGNDRILVYNLDANNDLVDHLPDNVLGFSNFYEWSVPNTNASGISNPSQLEYDATNDRLFVAGSQRDRILVFDTSTITDGEDAVSVLGQTDFISSGGATVQNEVDQPRGLAYDLTRDYLFVSDCINYRVLVFDVASITNGEDAINVLGQTDFTTKTSGTTQSKFNCPWHLAYDNTNQILYTTEWGTSRILAFEVATITDGMNASYVLGQSDFTSSTDATTISGLDNIRGIALDEDNQRLFVGDGGNNRVIVYDVSSISNGEDAVNVIGQSDFTTGTTARTQAGFNSTKGIAYDSTNGRIYVADYYNYRVMVFEVKTITASAFSPTDNANNVTTNSNLTITFTGTTGKTGTGYVTIYKSSDDSVIEQINTATGTVTGSGTTTVTINPTSNFTASTSYYVKIDAMAFYDEDGNSYAGIADSTTWNFTIASPVAGGGSGRRARRRNQISGGASAGRDYYSISPSLKKVGIFQASTIGGSGDATESQGQEGEGTMQTAAPEEPSSGEESANTGSHNGLIPEDTPTTGSDAVSSPNFPWRVCDRIYKRFAENQKMIDRVNRRLEKRFGFICSEN